MRKTITLGTVGIAGVVTAGLLALPIASAVTGDDEAVKRDEDAAEVELFEEDDRDDDSADPATRATATRAPGDHSRNSQTHDGQTHDGQTHDGQTHDGQTHDGQTHDQGTGASGQDATGGDTAPSGDLSGAGEDSGDDVSGGTGD